MKKGTFNFKALIKHNKKGLNISEVAAQMGLAHYNSLYYYFDHPGSVTVSMVKRLAPIIGESEATIIDACLEDIESHREIKGNYALASN